MPMAVDAPSTRKAWTSVWHRKATMYAFATLFISLAASMLLLWRSVKAQNGLSLRFSNNLHAWTYGPTAVLVVVVSLWRQVDYHCKMLQPWSNMRNRQCNAADSVMLDYVSPLQIFSLWQALRGKHWPVVCSILGFLTSKVVVLFSTGLLVSLPTIHSRDANLALLVTFDDSGFWSTVSPQTVFGLEPDQFNSAYSVFEDISGDPVYAFQRVLDHQIAAPRGIYGNLAYQHFSPVSSDHDLASLSADVDVFVPDVTCEKGSVPAETSKEEVGKAREAPNSTRFTRADVNFSTPSCSTSASSYADLLACSFCIDASPPLAKTGSGDRDDT